MFEGLQKAQMAGAGGVRGEGRDACREGSFVWGLTAMAKDSGFYSKWNGEC